MLFIDDEVILAQMGKDILERLGYRNALFGTLVWALETFSSVPDKFDLVIADRTILGDDWCWISWRSQAAADAGPNIPALFYWIP